MITVEFYGGLEQYFGASMRMDARNPGDVFWALASQCDAFLEHCCKSIKEGLAYKVIVDGEAIDETGLELPVISSISIAPIVVGAGDVGRILLGVALVGVGLLVPGGVLGLSSSTLMLAGTSMVLGGVISLLTGKPSEGNKNLSSYLIDPNGQPRSYVGEAKPHHFGDMWYIENPPIVSLWMDTENIPVDMEIT